MLGFWNVSVYITYLGTFSSILGLILGIKFNNINYAFTGMFVACVCDMFDGKVARGLKRTDKEKEFGVELDSLSDIVTFIVVPIITLYYMGMNEIYQIIILSLYGVCGVIRLAYFNVSMSDKDKAIPHYLGLPVPMNVVIFSIVWILMKLFSFNYVLVYTILVPIVGYLHISKIKIRKYTNWGFYIMTTIIAVVGILLAMFILK